MNGITKFFGEIITKLRLGWLVEKFSVNSFAVYLGSILVLIMIAVVFVIAIKKAKQKKLQKEDYIYYIGMVVYLLIAFFVLNTKLFGIGNDVDTIAYILLLIIVPLVLMIKYKNEQQKRIIKEKELVECKRILEVQKEQVVDSKKYYDNIRSIKHDINNHIKTMEMLVANS